MILAWQLGRAVIWLKRLALAQEQITAVMRDQWASEQARFPLPHARRPTEFAVASVTDWNKRWEDDHPDVTD